MPMARLSRLASALNSLLARFFGFNPIDRILRSRTCGTSATCLQADTLHVCQDWKRSLCLNLKHQPKLPTFLVVILIIVLRRILSCQPTLHLFPMHYGVRERLRDIWLIYPVWALHHKRLGEKGPVCETSLVLEQFAFWRSDGWTRRFSMRGGTWGSVGCWSVCQLSRYLFHFKLFWYSTRAAKLNTSS